MKIGDVVRAAIFLGRGQVDMAVEPHGVEQVNQHFTNLSCSRFSKLDLLFAPEPGHRQAETPFCILTQIREKYCNETNNPLLLWDTRLADWFATEIKRLDKLLDYYRSQSKGSPES